MSRTRRQLRMLNAATADLIAAAFSDRPVFRMGFDAHVRDWRAASNHEVWIRYHTQPAFAASYDARLSASRGVAR